MTASRVSGGPVRFGTAAGGVRPARIDRAVQRVRSLARSVGRSEETFVRVPLPFLADYLKERRRRGGDHASRGIACPLDAQAVGV